MEIRLRTPLASISAVLLAFLFLAPLQPSAIAQDLFNGTRDSASIGLGGSDLASPHGVLGAVSSNPAGIASVERRSLQVGGFATLAHGRFLSPYNTDGRLDPLLGLAPAAAFATTVGNSPWRVSVSAVPDTSLAANWYYDDAPGTAGVTYGYQQNRSALLNERFAIGVGRPLGRHLSAAVTFGAVYDSTTLIAPTIFQQQPTLAGLKTLLTLHTSGVGLNGTAGLIYAPVRNLEVAVSYKSPTSIHSSGTADGNLGALLSALGLAGSFRPDFHYRADLYNTLPQIGSVGFAWNARPRVRIFFRDDLVDWSDSFNHLSLDVSGGSNADLNGLVGADGFHDVIPLDWHNQNIVHAGLEAVAGRHLVLRGGYIIGNDPVPSATLTPLTAAITRQTLAAGAGYHRGRYTLDAAYQAGLPQTQTVESSLLRAGEYDDSSTELSTQTLSTTLSIAF